MIGYVSLKMPELRKDPVIGRWVIISAERGKRPSGFEQVVESRRTDYSPFSAGNETMTPPEIFAIRPDSSLPNSNGWTLRVVPNKYPALEAASEPPYQSDDFYEAMPGVGAHEVIVETPDEHSRLTDLSIEAISGILRVYQQRIIELRKDKRLKYVMIWKNHGHKAGASLSHAHSQLLATPMIPLQVRQELHGALSYYRSHNRCIFCEIIHRELREDVRVVYTSEHFVALQPYAARFPFETWILPRAHRSHFEHCSQNEIDHLAVGIKTMLNKLDSVLENPPYNFFLHTAPVQEGAMDHYHWHIELMPKLTNIAGFELGSGCHINPTSPEDAARYLREITV